MINGPIRHPSWEAARFVVGLLLGLLVLVGLAFFFGEVSWALIGYEPSAEVLDTAWFAPAPPARLVVDFLAGALACIGAGLVTAKTAGRRAPSNLMGVCVLVFLGLFVIRDLVSPPFPPYSPQPSPLWYDALLALALGTAVVFGGWLAVGASTTSD